MASVLAVLDKAAFKKYARQCELGAVLPIDSFQTTDRSFATDLSYGGALYLAIIGPNAKTLWLVGVLEAPEVSGIKVGDRRKRGWYATPNTTPVTDLTPLRKQLEIGRDLLLGSRVLSRAQDVAIRELLDDVEAPVVGPVETASAVTLDATLLPLERALRYLGSGALEQAIAAISEAWRASRAPQLADLVDRVARLMPASYRPLFDKRVLVDLEEASAVWNAAFDADPQGAMPQLLLNLGVGGSDEIPKRVERLSTLPLDPRFGARVIELFSMRSSTSYDDDSDAAWWQPVALLLSRSADARTFASILELESTGEAVGGTGTQLFAMAKKSTPKLPAADKPAVAKLEAELERREEPYRTECALVDQIAANPDDDDPYLVYADWLIEQGRPHGELIALCCQQRGSKLTPAKVRRLTQLSELPYLCGQFDDAPATRLRKRERGVDRELDIYWSMQPRSWRLLAASPLIRAVERIKLVGSPVSGRAEAIAELIEAAPALQRIDDIGLTTAKQVMKRVDTFEYLAPKLTRAQRASAMYEGRSVEVYLQRKR